MLPDQPTSSWPEAPRRPKACGCSTLPFSSLVPHLLMTMEAEEVAQLHNLQVEVVAVVLMSRGDLCVRLEVVEEVVLCRET